MVKQRLPEIVVPKEKAVFWMDKFGRWHNQHGPFEHKKIIDYFNSCIRKDKDGYYLGQIRDDHFEKVYFEYVETPLFVVDAIIETTPTAVKLILNTMHKLMLDPEQLFVRNDNLYLQKEDEIARFTDRVLLKISSFLTVEENKYYFEIEGSRYAIDEKR